MPRRARRGKSAIGANNGIPSGEFPMKASLTSGGPGIVKSYPWSSSTGVDGSVISTFPTFEPVFTNRPHILQIESGVVQCNSFNTPASSQSTAFLDNYKMQFGLMVDNLARAYANAQLLQLTTQGDFGSYLNSYMTSLSGYLALISILNADGYNDRLSNLAQVLTPLRSRIITGYERLQTAPIVPGLVDMANRTSGLFSMAKGDPVILHYGYNSTSGTPLDLTVPTNITTLLTSVELLAGSVISGAESGQVRTVLAEYYGDPTPLPFPGVKVGRSLFEQFLIASYQNIGTTNVFAAPAVVQSSATFASTSIPLMIPRGCENDPWWHTLYRFQPFSAFNNVAKGSAAPIGLWTQSVAIASTINSYANSVTSPATTFATGGSLNGFSNPMNDFYWAPLPAASDITEYADDVRIQRDYTLFNVSFDYMVQQTVRMQNDMYSGKKRIPLPSDITEHNTGRVRG